jgi:hypothetical protein
MKFKPKMTTLTERGILITAGMISESIDAFGLNFYLSTDHNGDIKIWDINTIPTIVRDGVQYIGDGVNHYNPIKFVNGDYGMNIGRAEPCFRGVARLYSITTHNGLNIMEIVRTAKTTHEV